MRVLQAWWYGRYGAALDTFGASGGSSSAATNSTKLPKICVYSIALNEVKNVDAFMDHCEVRCMTVQAYSEG